ncbi:hypothetical protein [Streptomyces monomycini]|uniref:hypothetical protein n=1 Tax=Streptomyces monomycini TaxID=371720 RepID=UPI0004AA615A|nr:hypothetical protein [Streptomyces monomycini]
MRTHGLPATIAAGVLVRFGAGPGAGTGMAEGITAGIGFGLAVTSWGSFGAARICLALRRQVPWDLMGFLEDAHRSRGVLRQVGAVYQFRHIDLQRHLAQQRYGGDP